jgi:hypothetical protein
LWFDNVREAKPLYQHSYRISLVTAALPVIGVIGSLTALWRARGTALFGRGSRPALLSFASTALLLWQTRAGPGAQLLAVPGRPRSAGCSCQRLVVHRDEIDPPVRLATRVSCSYPAVHGDDHRGDPPAKAHQVAAARSTGRTAAARRCPRWRRSPAAAATILTFVDLGRA